MVDYVAEIIAKYPHPVKSEPSFVATIKESALDLDDPAPVQNKTPVVAAYVMSDDEAVDQFLTDCFDLDPESSVKTARVYELYTQWCSKQKQPPMNERVLGRHFKKRDFSKQQRGNNREYFRCGLKEKVSIDIPSEINEVVEVEEVDKANEENEIIEENT